MALTADQKSVITSTIPLLESHGLEITRVFYTNVLNDFPTLRSLFSLSAQITDRQAEALATAFHAYATNINDLSPILPAIERINQKHASLDISEPQYAVVGTNLIRALLQVLGRDVFTIQAEEAWSAAYKQLADLMIKREDDIMNTQGAEVGGWKGWRKMRLARKVVESSEITSFYWVPIDGGALPVFKPGQYISIRVDVPVDVPGGQQIRQYSLSDAPSQYQPKIQPSMNGTVGANGDDTSPQYYRNSIKREEGDQPGLVSNLLHDTHEVGSIVEMSHPSGEFFLDVSSSSQSQSTSPFIFISAGVGQTPLLSMLNSLTPFSGAHPTGPITYIHTARSKLTHAFPLHTKALANSTPNLTSITFHTQPLPDEVQGQDYDFAGRLDLGKVDPEKTLYLDDRSAQYFVCGPAKFMADVAAWLGKRKVDGERVKMEVFGSGKADSGNRK